MRNISPAALAQISEREGTEPITLVQVFWTEDQYDIFGDRAFVPGIKGQLLDVGEINNVLDVTKGTNSGNMSVRLDDKDGRLKTIFDTMDIHKRPVYILQWFPEIPLNQAFVVFDGIISSPITWNEGERTVSFDVLNKIEDLELGYSAEEGNFSYIPPNIVGKAWPLVFGNVFHLPCIQINESPQATSLDDYGTDGTAEGPLKDLSNTETKNITLLEELERECFTMAAILLGEADALDSESVTSRANAAAGLHGGGTVDNGVHGGDTFDRTIGLDGSLTRHSDNPVAQQLYDLGTQYEEKGNEYHAERLRPFNSGLSGTPEQKALQKNQLRVNGGSRFPQKTNIIIRINGVAHEGYFEGDVFTIQSSTTPFTDGTAVVGPTTVVDRAVATEYKTDLAVGSFLYSIAGSTVSVGGTYPIWYIVGIPHLTNITVLGEKTTTGNTKYTIPASWYTIVYKTFGDLQATFIVFNTPLSARDEHWSDNIWVNCTSPLGQNGADVLEYIVENYTNQSIDTASFSLTKPLLASYKCNFAFQERKNAMQALQEVAYQLRCAIWFKGGRFYIKYLPKVGTPVDTLTEDDVEAGTMEVFGSETEDVVTKWEIDWKDLLDKSDSNKIVYRYHIKKYGLIEQTYNCYIFNNKANVQKFAQFWLIRKANTWKKIRFSTFMSKLRLEPFDEVLIDFSHPWVNDPGCVTPTIGVVEEAAYDSDAQRIQLTVWLPIRFGEMCPYPFAFPSDLDTTFIFPQENDPGTETDVPGSKATGDLLDQKPHTGPGGTPQETPPNSGFGGDTQPGDSQDATNPAYDPPVALDPTQLVNTGAPAPVQTVSQRVIKPLDPTILNIPDAVFPGKIISRDKFVTKDGETFFFMDAGQQYYTVDVYENGISKPPKRISNVFLLLNGDSAIPPDSEGGTPCIVLRNCQRNDKGLVTGVEYTTLVPFNGFIGGNVDLSGLIGGQTPQSDPGTAPGDGRTTTVPQADEGDQ
jgi:hypothetical protein